MTGSVSTANDDGLVEDLGARANDQHPKTNKSRDEKRAAWRDIRSGF